MSAMMEYARAVRLVGASARIYAGELAPLLRDLAEALVDVVLICAQLAAALARPLRALLRALLGALGPPAATGAAALWGLFLRQSPEALAIEAAGGCAILGLVALEARFGVLRGVVRFVQGVLSGVAGWYRGLKRGVREKSRLAGVLLSHIVFIVPVLVVCAWARGGVGMFVRKYGLYLVSCFVPGWRTARVLYRIEEEVEGETPERGRFRAAGNGSSVSAGVSDAGSDFAGGDGSDDDDGEAEAQGAPLSGNSRAEGAVVTQRETPPSASGVRRRRKSAASSAVGSPTTITPQRPVSATNAAAIAVTPKSKKVAQRDAREQEAQLLHFWAVFGVAWAARSATRYFTPAMFEPLVDRLDTFIFFFLLWLQIGLTRGADVMFPLLASALRQSQYLRANAATGSEQLNIFLRVLVSVGAVPPERAALIASTLTESGVVLVGIIFFITPRSVTFVGTLLTGYFVPIYLSVFAATPASLPAARQTWLSYWTAFSVAEALYSYLSTNFDWMPLWYHFKLALILWLQVPYYRGAASVLDAGMEYYAKFISKYRRTIVSPRKRRIA